MEGIVGLKELRTKFAQYIARVKRGQSFIVIKRSRPVFKIMPINERNDQWETVIDFTKVKQRGVSALEIISRL